MRVAIGTRESPGMAAGACTGEGAPPEARVEVVGRRFGGGRIARVAPLADISSGEAAVEDDGDVVAFGVSEVPEHSMERAVGDACDAALRAL